MIPLVSEAGFVSPTFAPDGLYQVYLTKEEHPDGVPVAWPSTGGGPVLVFAADTENVGAVQVIEKPVGPMFVITCENDHEDRIATIPCPDFKDITSAPFPLLEAAQAISAAFKAAAPASVLAYGKEKPATVFKLVRTPVGLTAMMFRNDEKAVVIFAPW